MVSYFSKFFQSALLSAAEQKGFELLEIRGQDPRLASLDTLSGEDIPLHFLFRLHSYIIQVGESKSPSTNLTTATHQLHKVSKCQSEFGPVFCPRWCSCMSGLGTTCGTALCASKPAWTEPLLPSDCSIMDVTPERLTGEWHAHLSFLFLCVFVHTEEAHTHFCLLTPCRPQLVLTVVDGLDVRVPRNISHFISEQRRAHFLECRHHDARNFLQVRQKKCFILIQIEVDGDTINLFFTTAALP